MKILVAFGTNGGTTMMVAQKMVEVLNGLGEDDVTLRDMSEMKPEELMDYSAVFIGCSTWGDGEYNDYAQVFFDEVNGADLDLSGSKFALYGLGESFYPIFCGVIDLMIHDLGAKNAQLVGEPLKIDGFPDDNIMEQVAQWVTTTLPQLK